jgi:hypothetical protein
MPHTIGLLTEPEILKKLDDVCCTVDTVKQQMAELRSDVNEILRKVRELPTGKEWAARS